MAAIRLLVMSGKGGTGKTTVMASLAALADEPILADCDVDAPDLHLLLDPEVRESHEYLGLQLATIDDLLCTKCGSCHQVCRYDAISEDIILDESSCEGCTACSIVCPEGAITMEDRVAGDVFVSSTRFGPMAHAKLRAGEEASGKLVMEVRRYADNLALEHGSEHILIDGPPGIGCPAISALSGVDAVLVVAEPTLSGRQGLSRAVELAHHFDVPAMAVVNRAELNPEEATVIEGWCRDQGVEVFDRLPYDTAATDAMMARRTVVEHDDGPLAQGLRRLWVQIQDVLDVRYD
jgi:MinD superfamily P-loop ATPase